MFFDMSFPILTFAVTRVRDKSIRQLSVLKRFDGNNTSERGLKKNPPAAEPEDSFFYL
jgi:hypothetical protein